MKESEDAKTKAPAATKCVNYLKEAHYFLIGNAMKRLMDEKNAITQEVQDNLNHIEERIATLDGSCDD